ncbi:MAG TPA: hypothetical protein VFV80_04955, partial [Geminicoccaceae bacterium]|nr:hypothetical protein [Geminicoccaceae bacterium]
QEKAATIEAISYNEAAGRFEYQVVRDYREGGAAKVYYADRPTCIACHRNHAPIFSRPLWDETNANAAIAATLASLRDSFYGIPVARGVDIPNAIDDATDRANSYAALQRIWREGCETPGVPEEEIACRADALLAMLRYRLAGNRHPAPDRESPATAFAAALERRWPELWPGGLALPEGDVPNRAPLAAPLDPRELSEATAIRLTTIPRAFEPFMPRPPHEVWQAPATPEQTRRLVEGLAQFVADADIQRLDDFLWRQEASTVDLEASCTITTVDLANGRREIRIDCPGPEGPVLHGYVQLQRRKVLGGAIRHLQIDGQMLTNLEIAGGAADASDDGRLGLLLKERTAGLHARLPDGRAIRQLTIEGLSGEGPHRVTLTVADDFSLVLDAVAAMREQARSGVSDALAPAPMRRAALMPALFAVLGAEPIDWCCLDAAGMPAAALEP